MLTRVLRCCKLPVKIIQLQCVLMMLSVYLRDCGDDCTNEQRITIAAEPAVLLTHNSVTVLTISKKRSAKCVVLYVIWAVKP